MPSKKVLIPTSLGIIAPARSLTDSIMLPQGCLMKATNVTFTPGKQLALWRPKLVQVNVLVEDPNETVVAASYDCGILCFISRLDTTYKLYAYKLSSISTPNSVTNPAPVATVLRDEEGLTSCCVIGQVAVFAVEDNPPFYYDISTEEGWFGGSICYLEAGSGDYVEMALESGQEYDLTQITISKKTKLANVRIFFARSMPDFYGKCYLKFYVNDEYKTRSIELLYIGALPDFNTYNPVESTQFMPVDFELAENLLLQENDVVKVKLYVDQLTPSEEGTSLLLVQPGDQAHEFLGSVSGQLLHSAFNNTFQPNNGLVTSGQGRIFAADTSGMIYSSNPTNPFVFEGYVPTGLTLVALFAHKTEVIGFSEEKSMRIKGIWPDQMEEAELLYYGVNCHQGVLFWNNKLFLAWGGTLGLYGQDPIANPFLADPTIASYLNYYKRLNLLIMSLRDEGKHLVFQLNGMLATVWTFPLLNNAEIITLCGDFTLLTNGIFYSFSFDSTESTDIDKYEVELLTRAYDTGEIVELDKIHVLSGLVGPGQITLLACTDTVDYNSVADDGGEEPLSQWVGVSLPLKFMTKLEEHVDWFPVTFDYGLYTAADESPAPFLRHPINCYSMQPTTVPDEQQDLGQFTPTRPSGWAFAMHLKLEEKAKKTPGVLLGSFELSVAHEKERIGFGLWQAW